MKQVHSQHVDDESYFDSYEETSFLKTSYEEQIKLKSQYINTQFQSLDIKSDIKPIILADHPQHYRHKVTSSATNTKANGKWQLKLGFYIENTHKIKPVFESILQHKAIENTLKNIETILQKNKFTAYVKGHSRGIIKHVLIKRSYDSGDLLVVFVTQGRIFPNSKQIIGMIREKNPSIKTVVQIIQNTDTHIVLYGEDKVLYGPGYIIDKIDDLSFKLSAKSFYQVNPEQMMKLYHNAFDLANINKSELVVDCYSGIGTLSLLAAKKAKSVVAVEMNATAVKDAIENASRNHINNVKFIKDDAAHFLETYQERVDVLLIDPPRIGVSMNFIEAIKTLKPKRIVYISCFVETQIRDIKQLNHLYDIEAVQPVDMFPYTSHIENIVLLTLK